MYTVHKKQASFFIRKVILIRQTETKAWINMFLKYSKLMKQNQTGVNETQNNEAIRFFIVLQL